MLDSLLLHVDRETLVKPAGLALVPPGDVHHTPPIIFTEIVQSPERHESIIRGLASGLSTELYPPCRQPPDTSLKKSSAAVTRRNPVMFPAGLVSAHLTRDVSLSVKRRQQLGMKEMR